ncbi:ATP-binding protein [Streptomyces odontomachi]|uniref:ATP-binding protein n=1 Tax=Streptomyces odontomachi TaxID=2944940 RepID=UPI00210D8722|nr:ATP-binding protein [Streptomyces sp. ODS25]
MISQPHRQCTVELQALPSRIGQVRRIVLAQLRHWRLDALTDQAALGVTELLTNVHRHALPDKTCTVDIELLLHRLTVSVHDHDPRLPRMGTAESFATCGRGLAMIAAMCDSWGARAEGEVGKVVWFTLPAPATTTLPPCLSVYGAATTGPFADPVGWAGPGELVGPLDPLSGRPGPLYGPAATRSALIG